MKHKIIYMLSLVILGLTSCNKKFLEDMKSYDKYDESVFTNSTQTGWYIDGRYYDYYSAYTDPTNTVVGLYNGDKSAMTEELGGTVSTWIDPTKTLSLSTDANNYYEGAGFDFTKAQNNSYTRIRYCNFLIEKMDGVGKALDSTFRKTAKGQMYFFRALQYYDLVRTYGGVPLVTTVQDASSTDATIKLPRSTPAECFKLILQDLDSAASMLPVAWAASDYGRFTSVAAIAMKSRVLLTAASPLFNKDWDNSGSTAWQAALKAGLDAKTALDAAGYGLYGTSAKDWAQMTYLKSAAARSEAIMVRLLSNTTTTSTGTNNGWEKRIRLKSYNGGGGISAPKGMLDLFPLADGSRPIASGANQNYVDTFFFENRDPRFYRTFAFSGLKWNTNGVTKTGWLYRWKDKASATSATYSGNNQTNSPAVVYKFSDPSSDSATSYANSGTDIFEYRYAELLLNIAECYAATGDVGNCLTYLGMIRKRVGIPAGSDNTYGIGALGDKYAALEAVLYERRVELAYEGKRFWDVQRWMLYDGGPDANNTCAKLRVAPINGTNRTGYYWQSLTFSSSTADPLTAADKNILIDPDNASTFNTQIAALKTLYKNKFVMTPLDKAWDLSSGNPVNILFRPNYYISGLTNTVLSNNSWLAQTAGWSDFDGGAGTFTYR